LDTLINRIWPQCTADNLAAINTYTRLADQRAKLMGLYPRDPVAQIGIVTGTGPKEPEGIEIRFVPGPGQRGKTNDPVPPPKPEPNPYAHAAPDYAKVAIEAPRPRQQTPFGAVHEAPREPQQPHDPFAHLPKMHPPTGRIDNTQGGGDAPSSMWNRSGDPKGWMR
jgi:hypothetical protein